MPLLALRGDITHRLDVRPPLRRVVAALLTLSAEGCQPINSESRAERLSILVPSSADGLPRIRRPIASLTLHLLMDRKNHLDRV